MKFGTSIHCMDGRIQEPIIHYLKNNYNMEYVDAITEPGPCKILADNQNRFLIHSILERNTLSVSLHGSELIAISGHHDCAGNPADAETQMRQVRESISLLQEFYPDTEIIGLWVDENWTVHPVETEQVLNEN